MSTVPAPTPEPPLHIGRWQLPGGRISAGSVRGIVRGALQSWGLGPAAAGLGDRVAPLVQDLVARAATRCRGPLVLRLELHQPARLLLGEIHDSADERPGRDGPGSHLAAIAITYGRRLGRGGSPAWYTHAFVWPTVPAPAGGA
ncbi:hypothetical protein SAMN05443665_104711 [Actinomadura meyerae]|jgi:hypothetical protein|uniref:ATP-binding protein n=1 Tax=Actinomadura meyerae TaxID=240840 RepID=A0A239NR35_9ACTN|nr:hypothetical protein [Actinomadura meyerae]SNT57347.1 hypothetical protein SAMN05443665_104711 [Actinomadura meyerae]